MGNNLVGGLLTSTNDSKKIIAKEKKRARDRNYYKKHKDKINLRKRLKYHKDKVKS